MAREVTIVSVASRKNAPILLSISTRVHYRDTGSVLATRNFAKMGSFGKIGSGLRRR